MREKEPITNGEELLAALGRFANPGAEVPTEFEQPIIASRPSLRSGWHKPQTVVGERVVETLSSLMAMGGTIEPNSAASAGAELREVMGYSQGQWSKVFTIMKGMDVLDIEPDANSYKPTAIRINPNGVRKTVRSGRLPGSLLDELAEFEASAEE